MRDFLEQLEKAQEAREIGDLEKAANYFNEIRPVTYEEEIEFDARLSELENWFDIISY